MAVTEKKRRMSYSKMKGLVSFFTGKFISPNVLNLSVNLFCLCNIGIANEFKINHQLVSAIGNLTISAVGQNFVSEWALSAC